MNKIALSAITLMFFWVSCTQNHHSQEEAPSKMPDPAVVNVESKKANDFFERVFNERLERSPMFQTTLGIKKNYDSWDDPSDSARQAALSYTKKYLEELKTTIDYELLDAQTKISYDLFVLDSENEIADFKYRYHRYPVNQMFGFHTRIPSFLINKHLIDSKEDAEAYLKRLDRIEDFIGKWIIELKLGEEKGIVLPKFVFPHVIGDCRAIISGVPFDDGPKKSSFLKDFTKKVQALEIAADEKEKLIDSASKSLVHHVKPAYESLIAFLSNQEQSATTDDGVWKFPDGANFYNTALARTTTTSMTSEEIHELGLSEVTRIHNEMREIMKKTGFDEGKTLQDFFAFMRDDPQFYYENTDEQKQLYMDSATIIINNMKAQLGSLFNIKPKAEMIVKRVEDFREKSAGKAFYERPSLDGSRPGIYYANLYNTKDMPKYEMEALAYHEGIPGHHMQLAIAQELDDLPQFRKYSHYTAYIEGWGLYCEKLPKEAGGYSNPYSDYGRLAMELWRACRLVVDTGIHSKKWTREKGIKYYQANTSASERECVRMVERHIVMPSQATSYKIGMNKILDLRAAAEQQLGDQFDIREFHDIVLKNGAVPLNVLEKLVHEWVNN